MEKFPPEPANGTTALYLVAELINTLMTKGVLTKGEALALLTNAKKEVSVGLPDASLAKADATIDVLLREVGP